MRRHLLPPKLAIDRTSSEPMHRQLARALRHAIEAGDSGPGTRLPSTRALAEMLGLSRNTVLTAYEELAADGLLVTRGGSGTRVRGKAMVPRFPDWRGILRAAQFPLAPARFRDADGNGLYLHR